MDETGNRYGRLTVISRNTDPSKQIDGRAMWNCECDCGNTYIAQGRLLRNGHVASCGCGIKSKGEEKVEELLKNNGINFVSQYKVYIEKPYEEKQKPHPFYFDFAVINDGKVEYLIEYDGEQHFTYKENHSLWSKETFEKTLLRDSLKNNWCLEQQIPLIRIPYTHYNQLCIDDLLLDKTEYLFKAY